MSKRREEQVRLNVYQDDQFFQRVKSLAKPNGIHDSPVTRANSQAKLMEDALDIVKESTNEQQKGEVIRIIATRDPIMWYLLCLNADMDVENIPPEMLLKQFIMTLNIFRTQIVKQYSDIIQPKLWGKPLEKKYMEFEQFAEGNIDQEYYIIGTAIRMLPVLFGCFIFSFIVFSLFVFN